MWDPVGLQPPGGGVPGAARDRLQPLGVLEEPGGPAGHHVCLHGPGLRAAPQGQPLEVTLRTHTVCVCVWCLVCMLCVCCVGVCDWINSIKTTYQYTKSID